MFKPKTSFEEKAWFADNNEEAVCKDACIPGGEIGYEELEDIDAAMPEPLVVVEMWSESSEALE